MRLAFVDLETTGGSPVEDRITEVGIIEVDVDPADPCRPLRTIGEWSTLVNPDAPIPGFVQSLTGITNEMVATAPRFDQLAAEILARLEGRLFVAHNARFDHGFLKNAFRRMGQAFRPAVLCTVRLSRKLYPGYARHSLDALIERHRLDARDRHRAMGDARLLWQLWQRLHAAHPADQIAQAIDQLTARPSLPRHLDPEVLDRIPRTAGVYLFYGEPPTLPSDRTIEEPRPLYIGKAKNLRQRVMAHFTGDHLSAREMEISQQLRRIEWIETGGGTQEDLGALLMEATLVKRLQPAYNRQLRKNEDICAWRLVINQARGSWQMKLARPDDLFFLQDTNLYGPFRTPRHATAKLKALIEDYSLCPVLLKIERAASQKPCFSYLVGRCRGACIGIESAINHAYRLRAALSGISMFHPSLTMLSFVEGSVVHHVRNFIYQGFDSFTSMESRSGTGAFDIDVVEILNASLKRSAADTNPLSAPRN